MDRRRFIEQSVMLSSGALLGYSVQGMAATAGVAEIDEQHIKSAADSSDIVYTPIVGSAAITSVQKKLRESISVKDFGAIGDGVVDDTVAIQAAVNYGSHHNRNVIIPTGVYLCSTSIYLYFDPVFNPYGNSNETNGGTFSIKGEGRFAHLQFVTGPASWIGTVLHFTSATKDGLVHSKLIGGATRVSSSCKGIENLSVVCNTTGYGLNLAWFCRGVISNVGVFNENLVGGGINLIDCWEYSIKDCMVAARSFSRGIGIQIRNQHSEGGSVEEIRGCTVLYFTKGIAVGQPSGSAVIISTMIDYNLIYGCVTGIECDGGSWKTIISRNYFEGSKGTDVLILAALATDIQNNAHSATNGRSAYVRIDLSEKARGTRVWQNFIALYSDETGIKIAGAIEANSVIAGNHFVAIGKGARRHGIHAVGHAHQQSVVTGNTFEKIEFPYSGTASYIGRLEKSAMQLLCSLTPIDPVFVTRVAGDVNERFVINAAGEMAWGSGSAPVDSILRRIDGGILSNQAEGKIISQGGFGFGNSAAATTLGSVVKKIEVFDGSGASLGFVPVYATID